MVIVGLRMCGEWGDWCGLLDLVGSWIVVGTGGQDALATVGSGLRAGCPRHGGDALVTGAVCCGWDFDCIGERLTRGFII